MELNDIEKDWTPSPKFYIWGVPNRGEEVAKLIQDKGVDIIANNLLMYGRGAIVADKDGYVSKDITLD